MKKEFMYKLAIAITGIVICGYCAYLSGFPVEMKVFLFVVTGIGCLPWKGRMTSKLYIGLAIIITALSLYYSIVPYGQHRWNYSAAMNKFTHGVATQSEYVQGTGNADVILPAFLKKKTVFIGSESPYKQYVEFFAEDIVTDGVEDDLEGAFEEESLKDEYIYVGRMSITSLDFLVDKEDCDNITNLTTVQKRSPALYMESSDIAAEDVVVAVNDSEYNIYILTYDSYRNLTTY